MKESKKYKSLIQNKAIYFTNPDDVKFLTNFSSSNMQVLCIEEKWFAITDNRYIDAAKNTIKNMKVLAMEDKPFKKVILPIIKKTTNELVFDSSNMSVALFNNLSKLLKEHEVKLVPMSFVGLREIKTNKEIDDTRIAVKITDEIFLKILNFIKVGMTEKKVIQFIEKSIINLGLKKAFDPIVAAGINTSEAHHEGTNYEIQAGDMVTIDFGLHYNNMCSDMTRTISVGKLPSTEEQQIHQIVVDAMNKSINAIKPGKTGAEIDKIARNYIKKYGYSKNFGHGLGHGLGINVHEEPKINAMGTNKLEPGMLITIEPGIYISGKYGVRVEQDVVVTEDGYEVFNKSTTDLVVV